MKFLLTSAGLANDSIKKSFFDLVEKPTKEIKIAFIPTASNIENGDKSWLVQGLADLQEMGFAQLDIVDIAAVPKVIWKPRLEEANVFFFGGGNPFYLKYWLEKSGLKDYLPELLKSRVWVGISAGSMVSGINILTDTDRVEAEEILNKVLGKDGLSFVSFTLKPHYLSPLFEGRDNISIAKEAEQFEETVYAIDDRTAIMVNGDKIEVISEGKWKKFNI